MQLTKKQFWLFLGSLLLVAALTFSLTFLFARRAAPEPEIRYVPVEYPAIDGVPDNYRELCAALRLYSYYGLPDDVDYAGLLARTIVASTGDPYAEYFTAEEYAAYRADLDGVYKGIGVTIDAVQTDDGEPAIRMLAVFAGSGAETAGLMPGDLVIAIDGESVSALGGPNAALERIRGEEGTTVTLTVLRRDETQTEYTRLECTVTRSDCQKQTVFWNLLDLADGQKIAYIRITAFNPMTLDEFVTAVEAAEAANASGLVFDLRYNGGGYLDTVAQMLAYLLPDGDISHIRYGTETLKSGDYTIRAENGKMMNVLASDGTVTEVHSSLTPEKISHEVHVPLAVLVNGSTASAAELFTSALRDYANDEAYPDFPKVTIVGSNTYGKGCMQRPFRLSDDSYLKVTVALYDPPSGVNYHGLGIAPTDNYATEANDTRVGDLYLKASEGATTLPDGKDDTVLIRALAAFTR